jgi:hypothetical protein
VKGLKEPDAEQAGRYVFDPSPVRARVQRPTAWLRESVDRSTSPPRTQHVHVRVRRRRAPHHRQHGSTALFTTPTTCGVVLAPRRTWEWQVNGMLCSSEATPARECSRRDGRVVLYFKFSSELAQTSDHEFLFAATTVVHELASDMRQIVNLFISWHSGSAPAGRLCDEVLLWC